MQPTSSLAVVRNGAPPRREPMHPSMFAKDRTSPHAGAPQSAFSSSNGPGGSHVPKISRLLRLVPVAAPCSEGDLRLEPPFILSK